MATPLKVIPSLSADGWVTEPAKMIDYLVSYYILTDYQQSYLYHGNLISLPYSYYLHNSDPDALGQKIREDIYKLLSRYFDQVESNTRVVKERGSESLYAIFISAAVIGVDLQRYEINKITHLFNSKAKTIINFNNYAIANQYMDNVLA